MKITKKLQTILNVERAVGDLKRGFPVIVTDGGDKVMAMPAENSCEEYISFMQPPLLTLTANRVKALTPEYRGENPVSLEVTPDISGKLQNICGHFSSSNKLAVESLKKAKKIDIAALNLVKIAQLLPAVITSRLESSFNSSHYLTVSAEEIVSYKDAISLELNEVCRTPIVLKGAENAEIIAFRPNIGGKEHYAIVIGEIGEFPLVRVHSSCYTGDLLDSLACDCKDQLHSAIELMGKGDGGIILYMMQEGRDIGLINKLRAYALKNKGFDTVDANEMLGFDDDERLFAPAAQMLKLLGINDIRLLTNNPRKKAGLLQCKINVTECVPHIMEAQEHNKQYLKTKSTRLGHNLG